MAKFTDAWRTTLSNYFNAGDQPTEVQFAQLMQSIQEGIEEHDHDGSGDGDGITGLYFGGATGGGRDIGWGAASPDQVLLGAIRSSGDPFLGKAVKSDGAVANRLNYATVANMAKAAIVLNNDGIYFAIKAAGVEVVGNEFAWATTYAGMVLDPSGRRSLPMQPAFSVHMNNVDQAFNVGTTIVEFDTETFDTGGDFNVGTYKFIAPKTGKYLLSVLTRLNAMDIDATHYRLEIVTSNRDYMSMISPDIFAVDPTYWSIQIAVVADMDAADEAYVNITQAGGANQTSVEGKADYTRFSGWFLG